MMYGSKKKQRESAGVKTDPAHIVQHSEYPFSPQIKYVKRNGGNWVIVDYAQEKIP